MSMRNCIRFLSTSLYLGLRSAPSRFNLLLLVLLITGFLMFPSSLLRGQTFVNGSIVGVVSDNSGGVVPQVSMTLTNLGTNAGKTTATDASGFYQFLDLPPGDYSVEAKRSGFGPYIRKPVTVEVNAGIRIDIVLTVGAVTQEVTVTGATPLLAPESSSLGEVVTSRPTNELPLNGRNPLALAELVTGVVPEQGAGTTEVGKNPFTTGNFQIEGAMAQASAEYWDGAPLNTGYEHNLALLPNQDALQEFKVQTSNLSAQYGKFYGGIVNFSTIAGTNKLHGSADEFLRNKDLNANNFFNNSSGLAVPAFTQNQFDINVGGPVIFPHIYNGTNRTFFFFSYGGFRLRQGQALLLTVPTQAEQQGNFSGLLNASGAVIPIYNPATTCGQLGNAACPTGGPVTRQQFSGNVIPTADFDSAATVLRNLWPAPILPGTSTGTLNWAGNAPSGGDIDQWTGRIDHNIGSKQRIFGRYTYDKWNNLLINPYGTGGMVDALPGGGQPELHLEQQIVLDDSYSISPTTIVDVNFSVLDQYYNRTAVSTGYNMSTLGAGWAPLNSELTYRTLPAVSVTGIDGFIANTGSEIREIGDNFDLAPNVTMIRGRHTLHVGGEWEVERFNYLQLAGAAGTFTFNTTFTNLGPTNNTGGFGFASFLIGAAASGSIPTAVPTATQEIYPAVYFEDDLKLTKKLTLNLGVRYERNGQWSERFNRTSLFAVNAVSPLAASTGLPLTGAFDLVASPQWSSRNNVVADNKLFSPRLGFAYQLMRNTVVRGGYGVFWVPSDLSFGANPVNNPINLYTNTMIASINGNATPYNTLSNPFPAGIVQPPQRNPIYQTDLLGSSQSNIVLPYAPYPYVQQWNLDVQRILPGNTLLDVAYAGSKGTHLTLTSSQLDQLPVQDLAMGSALNTSVSNPFFGLVPSTSSLATATTTAGQLLRPYPQYTGLSFANQNQADSHFESFQMTLRKDLHSGQTILTSYTNSKLITNGSDTFNGSVDDGGTAGIQNYDNLDAEQSLSSFDTPQRLTVAYVLDLPVGQGKRFLTSSSGAVNKLVSGWGIDGVSTFMKGFPLQFTTSSNLTDSFGGGSRPNFNSSTCPNGAALGGSGVTRLSKWFNTACFSAPAAFTFGDVSRTEPNIRSDGVNNWDFAMFKRTTFGPDNRFDLAFRVEFFNLVNHPQFDFPGQSFGTSTFGVVSAQLNNPRLVQFGLKLSF